MISRMPDSKASSGSDFIVHGEAAATFKGAPSFTLKHRLTRAIWLLVWKVFASWTPPPLHRWRIFLVNLFGGDVHPGCSIYGSAKIWFPRNLTMDYGATLGPRVDCYSMAPIHLGAYCVVSQGAHLCTGSHRIHDESFQIYAREITIGANAWIAAEAFVGPGVSVGEGAVLGARAVTFNDLESWTVYLGNPAQPIKKRARFQR
ncbi:MAG: putative colanic acid biosynthesis acetyltransferase [Gammaproteobacteria bacterium]